MKQKPAFAMMMGIITTGIISFTGISLYIGTGDTFLRTWLKSWDMAFLVVISAILLADPLVRCAADSLFHKKITEHGSE